MKGGHGQTNESNDLFLDQKNTQEWLTATRIESKNTHGTGCTLSAAICALLAQGFSLLEACKYAKRYLHNALVAAKENSVGKGHGPVHHFYHVWPTLNKI